MKKYRFLWKSKDGGAQGLRGVKAKNEQEALVAVKKDCPDGMYVACVEKI